MVPGSMASFGHQICARGLHAHRTRKNLRINPPECHDFEHEMDFFARGGERTVMWLVDREIDGRGASRIPQQLELRAALVRWSIDSGTVADEQASIILIQQARSGHRWIACGCLGANIPPPILTPAYLSEAETYYLCRLTSPKRPEHLPDCPFFCDQVTMRIREVRSRLTALDPPEGFFAVLKPAPENLAQRPLEDSNDDRARNGSIPRLARLLWFFARRPP